MKIFGKVKSSSAAATSAAENKDDPKKDQVDVQSYFASAEETSSKKKKQKKSDALDGDNIDVLLKMDFSTLNSKQRRLVKRHKAREGNLEGNQEAEEIKQSTGNNEQNCSKGKEEVIEQHIEGGDTCVTNDMSNAADTNTTESSMDISEIVKKLDGLNSKERRKFLRQLKSNGQDIDEQVLAAAQDEAKKVAERNEKEANNTSSTKGASASSEGKRKDSSEPSASNNETSKPKKKRRKKNAVDLEDLPPEERARREEQRRMQKEAAERRAAGLVDPNRHPLNSERRRANRRKPGKAAQIAQAKKERMADGGKFNAVGYQMRKGGN
jgi:hypothetical protein